MNDTKEKHATHTPGPWGYSEKGEIYRGNNPIASVIPSFGWFNKTAEDEANARLIANSTEMLEQCKLFEKVLSEGDLSATHDGLNNCDKLAKLREVLAKVDGGEG